MPPLVLAALLYAASRIAGPWAFAAYVLAVGVVVWLATREKGHAGRRASRQPRRGADAALTRSAPGAAVHPARQSRKPRLSPPGATK